MDEELRGHTWCTIESDPGVFTELVEKLGVKGVQVDEILTYNDVSQFEKFEPLYGLILLFKFIEEEKMTEEQLQYVNNPNIYFAKQKTTNACATQALLSIILNSKDIDIGDEMNIFKNQTISAPPDVKGFALGSNELIRVVHNSFARPEPFEIEHKKAKPGDDVYHFISYVPIDGNIYELDGLKEGPLNHGKYTDLKTWYVEAIPTIRSRFEKYEQKEHGFALLALTKNKREELGSKRTLLLQEISILEQNPGSNVDTQMVNTINSLREQLDQVEITLAQEEDKYESWKKENMRRKHDYMPFLFNFLNILAEKNLLIPLVDKAKEKHKDKTKKEN